MCYNLVRNTPKPTLCITFLTKMINSTYISHQARSQDLEKGGGGGYFERVRKVQTTLTQIFIEILTKFLGKLGNSKVFSAQNQVVSKKKRSSPKLRLIFRPNSELQTFEGGCFPKGGGIFSIFHKKSTSKAPKTCNFAYFTSQWGGSSPRPPPPWLRYCQSLSLLCRPTA